jgi:hypothetical protein
MAPQPLRQVSDMLSTFPTLNVTALEQGMQHFLGQLQRAGEDLTGTGHGPGLGIWLAAGAAAALACEVGRRQLRRANHGQALDVYWMGTSPSDHAFGD